MLPERSNKNTIALLFIPPVRGIGPKLHGSLIHIDLLFLVFPLISVLLPFIIFSSILLKAPEPLVINFSL